MQPACPEQQQRSAAQNCGSRPTLKRRRTYNAIMALGVAACEAECVEPRVVRSVDFRMTKATFDHSQTQKQPSRVKVVLNSDADHTPVQTEVLFLKKI